MKCPYLQQAEVQYCRNSVFRKMIVRTPEKVAGERCSSAAYTGCGVYREQGGNGEAGEVCPFLAETEVEYCAAAPVTKYVPSRASAFSRCAGERYRYCDWYLRAREGAGGGNEEAREHWVHGIRVPNWLYYASNHMWLDMAEDGTCHLGIDGFLAKVLGRVERVSFLTLEGAALAAVVLTAHGMDVQAVFPNPVAVTGLNQQLRGEPERLIADPYRRGWLFEGAEPVLMGLIAGMEAPDWMGRELERLGRFAQEHPGAGPALEYSCMADGGILHPQLAERLDREERFQLWHEFFSPYGKREA
ncbi:MAG TPA: hypothetical protein VFA33_05475 [Bryobacteraceae bacterium]|nr:hypothetical protein [Bryobacteraceae bacterium]